MQVSVIIPAYNGENSLSKCIDSVLAQTLPAIEVIVINDGSTDETIKVLEKYKDKIIIVQQENQGQGAARNAGLMLAKGDFIAFLDADDYWEPPFIEQCITFFREHREAAAVLTGWTKIIDESNKIVVPPIMHSKTDRPSSPIIISNFFKFWAEQDHVQTGAIMMRHDVIRQAGLQREDLRVSQDLEYWLYISSFGNWGFIPEPLFVSNSRLNARKSWIARYRKRRNLCPTVESWQKRLVPKILETDWENFKIIRGRVAANFAHSKILSGSVMEAKDILKTYGDAMPENHLTRLMRFGANAGGPTWKGICQIIRVKEVFKGWKLQRIAATS